MESTSRPSQAAGDLGLADAGGADHDDVLRRHLVAELGIQLLAAPAVAQRDRHRPLGRVLADDEAVELGDDLLWRQPLRLHDFNSSMVIWSLV